MERTVPGGANPTPNHRHTCQSPIHIDNRTCQALLPIQIYNQQRIYSEKRASYGAQIDTQHSAVIWPHTHERTNENQRTEHNTTQHSHDTVTANSTTQALLPPGRHTTTRKHRPQKKGAAREQRTLIPHTHTRTHTHTVDAQPTFSFIHRSTWPPGDQPAGLIGLDTDICSV